MAVTATIALDDSSATPGQVVKVTCTIATDAGPVSVLWVAPSLAVHSGTSQAVSGACGLPPLGPGTELDIAAAGSLDISWGVVAYEPQKDGASLSYDVGAVVALSNGDRVNATTATLTVSP